MNASRLFVAVAILGAFITGIATGLFVNSGSPPVQVAAPASPASERPLREEVYTEVKHSRGQDQMTNEIARAAVASRISTILALSDENARHRDWLSLLPLLSSSDAADVRELFRKMKAQGRRFDFELATFWPRWGELDGGKAMAFIGANESSDTQPGIAEMIMRGWAKTNLETARAWLAANPSTPFYNEALRGYLDGLARHDLDRATRDALTMGKGRDSSEFIEVLVEQALQQRQFDGMVDWWRQLPEGATEDNLRAGAVGHILSRLIEADPALAQTWITELAATPYRDDGSIGIVAERLATADPRGAVGWVTSLPPGSDGHYTGIGRTVRAWAAADKAGLERWVAGLPPSPLREQAIAAQQEQQSLVTLDVVGAHAEINTALKAFGGSRPLQIKTFRLSNGNVEVVTEKTQIPPNPANQ